MEQGILHEIANVIGSRSVSDSTLEWAPRWVLDKSIASEKGNYKDAFEEVHYVSVSKNAKLITSHHFFQVKPEGEHRKLRSKCRMVPHGNKDQDKELIRKDSATTQFPIIRLVLSLAAILQMSIASIHITKAYLQSGKLRRSRPLYVRNPKGWASSTRKVWILLRPA